MNRSFFANLAGIILAAGLMPGTACSEDSRTTDGPPVRRDELASLPREMTAGTLRVSPDGKRLAVAVVRGDKWNVYLDGTESPGYDAITEDSIHFSPDSKRVAYGAMRDGKGIVVVDGREFPAGLACAKGFPIFDASGAHFLYVAAQAGNKASVAVDGKEGETWEALAEGGPVFSPDGSRVFYVAKDGDSARAVLDGIAGPVYDHVVAPTFGLDGKHLAYVALTSDASILVIDGKEALRSVNFVRDSLAFDSPTRLHILSIDNGRKIARWQVGLPKAASERK